MKITNASNYRRMFEGAWFEPGETKKVDSDISEDEISYYFKLEDDNTTSTEEVEDDEDDEEEVSKSEEKNNENVGD